MEGSCSVLVIYVLMFMCGPLVVRGCRDMGLVFTDELFLCVPVCESDNLEWVLSSSSRLLKYVRHPC